MKLSDIKDLVFDSLADPICKLGCSGTGTGCLPECGAGGEHDTGLSMFKGEIYLEIDDKVFQISVKQIPEMP